MAYRQQYEAADQEAIFNWAKMREGIYPELKLLHHIPNGGSRNKIEAANLKRQGVKAGVPDICLPVARGEYHGLYIELKHGKNKLSNLQREWLAWLNQQGYLALCVYGWEDAVRIIEKYLNLMTGAKTMNKLETLQAERVLKQTAEKIDPILKSYVNEFREVAERIAEILFNAYIP